MDDLHTLAATWFPPQASRHLLRHGEILLPEFWPELQACFLWGAANGNIVFDLHWPNRTHGCWFQSIFLLAPQAEGSQCCFGEVLHPALLPCVVSGCAAMVRSRLSSCLRFWSFADQSASVQRISSDSEASEKLRNSGQAFASLDWG